MRCVSKSIASTFCASVAAAGLLMASSALATPVINVGINPIQPNSADQLVKIYVSDLISAAVEDLEAADVSVQIGNGNGTAPTITSVDLITGTIFASNNSGQFPAASGNGPQVNYESILNSAPGAYVNANGLLATIHISTLGVSSGSFKLSLGAGATQLGPSDFYNGSFNLVTPTITDGTIVVPEPASIGLIGLMATAVLGRRRRLVK